MKRFFIILSGIMILFSGASLASTLNQSITFGLQAVKLEMLDTRFDQSAKFEEYESVPRGFYIENYSINKQDDRWVVNFNAYKPLLIDQSYLLVLKGPIGLNIAWDQVPHNISFNSQTIYSQSSAGVFTLPDSLQDYLQKNPTKFTATMATYVATAESPVTLSTLRGKASAKMDVAPDSLLGFEVAVDQEKKTGSKPIAASASGVFELPEPVDYVTSNLKLHKNISIGAVQVDTSYKYTSFQNNIKSILFDNPKTLTDLATIAATSRVTLPPDNKAHEADINVGMDLPMNGRFNGTVYYVRTTQNDPFFAYTTNTKLKITPTTLDASDPANLPASSLNGRIDTLAQNYVVNLNPMHGTRVLIRYNSADVNNKTASIIFPGYSSSDTSFSAALTPESEGLSNKKDNIDMGVTFDLPKGWTLGTGYIKETINRNHREVAKTSEDIYKASLRGNLLSGVMVNASYLSGKRRMDSFNLEAYKNKTGTKIGSLFEQTGLRRLDVSDRNRTEYSIGLNASPFDNFILGAAYRSGIHNYVPDGSDLTGGNAAWANQMYGLLRQNQDGIGLNADLWLQNQTLQISTYLDHSNTQFSERSNTLPYGVSVSQLAANDWTANETDIFDTVGIEITKSTPDERISLGASYWISAGKGKIDLSDVASSARSEISPPDTFSQTNEFAIKANAKVTDDLSISGILSNEQFIIDDYATNNLRFNSGKTDAGVDSTNAIFLRNVPVPYRASKAQIATTYRF